MHRLDLGLYSHPKEFSGNGVKTHVNSKGKIPLPKKFSSEEDRTHDATSSRTLNPTHYQRAIPAPTVVSCHVSGVTGSRQAGSDPRVYRGSLVPPRWSGGQGVRLESDELGFDSRFLRGDFSRSSHTRLKN